MYFFVKSNLDKSSKAVYNGCILFIYLHIYAFWGFYGKNIY